MNLMRLRAAAVVVVVTACLATAGAAAAHQIGGIVPDVGARPALTHATMARFANVENPYDGPVLHSNRTHLIFWAPAGSGLSFDPGYESLMERFLADVAADSHRATNVYSLSGQYRDGTGPAAYDSTYGGAVVDTDPLPASDCAEPATGPDWPVCLTDDDLEAEINHVVSAAELPQTRTDIYFLVLPEGFATCTDSSSSMCALGGSQTGFCGYHSETDGSDILYAVIPYNAVPGHCESGNPRPNGSPADPALSTLSHEHNETVTDPDPYGSWIDSSGNEIGDLCITSFGPALGGSGQQAYNEVIHGGHFYLQEEWSNASGGCEPRARSDEISIGLPSHPLAGVVIKLAAHARAAQGSIVAYQWTFGDGNYGHRRITSPTFKAAGTYHVVLRTTDSWGIWAFASHAIRIYPAAAREPRSARALAKRG